MGQGMRLNMRRSALAAIFADILLVRGVRNLALLLVCLCSALVLHQGKAWGAGSRAEDRIVDKEIVVEKAGLKVSVRYPVLNIGAIDADIEDWARQTAEAFSSEFSETAHDQENELKATYRIIRASPKVVSVVWDVWNYTGGAHGNLDIVVFVYDCGTGQILELGDLFADEETALNLLSSLTYAQLPALLGDMAQDEMIRSGTSPDLDNFACVAPTPEGVRVFFQPYQVAPWAAELQEVNIKLHELQDAVPRREYWGK